LTALAVFDSGYRNHLKEQLPVPAHRRCGIHPRIQLSTEMEERKTDQGKNERFFAEKCQKTPIERKIRCSHSAKHWRGAGEIGY
jgi:hypothetical protein